jgi:hypothetical protein
MNDFPRNSVPGESPGRRNVRLWVQARIQGLPFRFGMRQPADMPLGTRVLVLKGNLRDDQGQMAIVSAILGSQVEISYRGPTGQVKKRRKHRDSLIRMEEGVELFVDEQGCPVLRATPEQGVTDDEDGNGVVSSDNED